MTNDDLSGVTSDTGDFSANARRIPKAILWGIEALVLLLALGAVWKARSAMPLVPVADSDTWGYLNPALSWLSGLGFQQTIGRDWLYPALLALFLKTTGSFAGIVVWQRALGIASGIVMAAAWRLWISTLNLRRWTRFLATLFGIAPIYIQLMSQQSILFETSLRPEAVLPFFVYAQLACLMGYYRYRWNAPARDHEECGAQALPAILFGAAAIALSYACFLLKPSWLLAYLVTAAPVFVGVFGRALPLRTRLLTPALGVALSALFLWLPPAVYLIKDKASVVLLPDALFAVHARLIDKEFDARLAKLADNDPEKEKLGALSVVLKQELRIAEIDKPYAKLGFNADDLMHSDTLTKAIYGYTGDDDRKFRAFCISSYVAAALYDPAAFASKIFVQFTYFIHPERNIFFKDNIDFSQSYKETIEAFNPADGDRFQKDLKASYQRYLTEVSAQAAAGLKLPRQPRFRKFRNAFTPLVLPLEALFFTAFAACLIWKPLRGLRVGGWAALSLFSAPLGNAVTVCVVHALDITRYRLTYGGFLLFALTAMGVFAVTVAGRILTGLIQKRRNGLRGGGTRGCERMSKRELLRTSCGDEVRSRASSH